MPGAQSATTLVLRTSASTSAYGNPVTLTAIISPPAASGKVTFYNGVTPLASVPVTNGQAQFSTSLLPAGSDTLRAYYSGDANDSASSASITQKVQAQPGGEFQPPHSQGVGYLPWSLAVADFNEDGKPDIAVTFEGTTSAPDNNITVSLGNGDGTFQVPVVYSGVVNPRWIVTGDFNGDGHADLAAANIGGDSISVFFGNGDGTFGAARVYSLTPQSNPYALVVADFNGDGKADLAVTGDAAQANNVTILLGNGDGSFQNLQPVACGSDPRSIAAGDFNRDGITDLVVGNYTDSTVTVLLGNGDGTFQPGTAYPVASAGDRSKTTNPRSIAVGDFNGDGYLDLAVANQSTGTVDILSGRGDGTFGASQSACANCSSPGEFVLSPYAVAAADVDGDNILDLVTANFGGASVTMLRGLGNGQFVSAGSFSADVNPTWVAVASLRANGRADVVTANNGAGTVSILTGIPPAPDLSIAWKTQSVAQAMFTIAVKNVGLSTTSGAVTVTVVLPAGVNATQLQGTGWSCSTSTLVCARADALSALGTFDPISLTLAFSANTPPEITLSASVSGGGDVNSANNSAREYATTFSSTAVANVWSPVAISSQQAPGLTNPDAALLMTDGSVLVHQFCSSAWYQLTPDSATGKYTSGQWKQVASMPKNYAPLYFSSAVLPDGRLVVIGGEYNGNGCTDHVETTLGAIYDPVADAWTPLNAPSNWSEVGDAPNAVLSDGRFVLGQINGRAMAALDPHTLAWTALKSSAKADNNSEEGWTLLPDGSLLTVDITNAGQSERYLPSTDTWVLSGDTVAPLSAGREMGPQVLLPDGNVFVAGATGHTSLYDTGASAWSAGPDFPSGPSGLLSTADAPGVLMPNGNVLLAASAYFPDALALYEQLAFFFEYDGTRLNPVPAPAGNTTGSYRSHLLLLPTGQVLFTDNGNSAIYTPTGSPAPAWAPTITGAPATIQIGQTYTVSGTQFNGLSQAVMYGDDYQAATNFPLVRITNNATNHSFYCRTHDHSTMAVATGPQIVSTEFDVSSKVETGASTLVVIANGIASAPRNVTVAAAVAPAVSIAAVVGGALSVPAVKAISSDGYFTIFGAGFQGGSSAAHSAGALVNGAFPTVLGAACVHIGSARAFLTYVSDTQINAIAPLLPPSASVPISVSVNCDSANQLTSVPADVAIASATPEFLYWKQNADGNDPVIAVGSDGTFIGPSGPSGGPVFRGAHPGEQITVFGIGFGRTDGGPVPGVPPKLADKVSGSYSVSVGSVTAATSYAGVTPDSSGLYQLNLTVPASLAPGNYSVVLTINGVSTPLGGFLVVGP